MVYKETMALTVRPKRRLVAAIAASALLLAACTGEASAEELIPAELVPAVENATGVQRDILADGNVTMEELGDAAEAVRQCTADAGVDIDHFSFDDGNIRIRMKVEGDEKDLIPSEEAYDACLAEEYWLVSDVYNYQNRLTAAEQQEYQALWLSCLQTRGLDIASLYDVDAGESPDQYDAVKACAIEMEQAGY